MTPVLLVFDIDGTLIDGQGAGGRALEQAFSDVLGQPQAFRGMEFAGRTDGQLIREALARHHLISSEETWHRLKGVYFDHLGEELKSTPPRILPGVDSLLARLLAQPTFLLAIGTGNFRTSAFMKLQAARLDHYFPCGGFSEDGLAREAIIRQAVQAATQYYGCTPRPVVIGDTRYDIEAAHQAGFPCLAVATGHYSRSLLQSHGADCVVDDLSREDDVVRHFLHLAALS